MLAFRDLKTCVEKTEKYHDFPLRLWRDNIGCDKNNFVMNFSSWKLDIFNAI